MLLSEAFRLYCSDVIHFKNQSDATEENHFVCLKSLLVFFDDVPIESLSFAMIRDWKAALSKHRSDLTVKNYIVRLRVVLDFCSTRGIPCLTPDKVPVPKAGDTVPVFINKEQVAELLHAVSTPCHGYARMNRLKNAAIVALLYASGIRVSELCGLNRSDIKDDGTFTVVGKGSKARLCFLDERANFLVNEYLVAREDNNVALFVSNQNTKRITPGNVQEVFRLARKKAGFTAPIHPHTMRHSFATNLMANGMHIYELSRLLGHSSIATTQMYLHASDPQLKESYLKHHSI